MNKETREEGFYWVKVTEHEDWCVAEWTQSHGGYRMVTGTNVDFKELEIFKINETLLKAPQ